LLKKASFEPQLLPYLVWSVRDNYNRKVAQIRVHNNLPTRH